MSRRLTTTYPRLTLQARTAADLMTPNPVSISETASLREALALLTDRGIKAAPVIDEAGRPIGVLSGTDLLIHDRERGEHMRAAPEFYHRADLCLSNGEKLGEGFEVETVDGTLVNEVMTPAVFGVAPEAPAERVIEEMAAMKVHRLFVVDESGVLVGVISALDVLRRMTHKKRREAPPPQ
jgi:CBS-domain-containing membrane protein